MDSRWTLENHLKSSGVHLNSVRECKVLTDHAALQWARTYENSNRRLASWGAVFTAYAPGLDIVHRPGRVHSNVDPLSRLQHVAPECALPAEDLSEAIKMSSPISQKQESLGVKFSLVCYSFKEVMEQGPQSFLTCCQEALEKAKAAKFQETTQCKGNCGPSDQD